MERGKFRAIFEAENRELSILVDQLFDLFFGGLDFDHEDGTIDVLAYHDALDDKLEGDPMLEPAKALFPEDQHE